jgi:AcrR family transcriptional regulator
MGVVERRARHKTALRQQILDAAREVFVTEGYQNVSMRKIAERIEYSPTTIYLYFRDKADLLRCLTEETFARLAEVIERIRAENPNPLDQLRKGLRTYVEFGLHNPNDYKVAFMLEHEPLMTGGRLDQPMAEKTYNFLRTAVRDCVEQGCFATVETETASQALWAAAHGITALLIIHPHFPWARREELIGAVIETALRGLQVRG